MASLELSDRDLARLAEHLAPALVPALLAELRAQGTSVGGDDPDRWLRTPEAARHLGIGISELQRRAAAGLIPHEQERPGAALFFKRSDLDEWRRAQSERR